MSDVVPVGAISHNEVAAAGATIAVTRVGIVPGSTLVVGIIGVSFACSTVDDGTTTLVTPESQVNQAALGAFISMWVFPNHVGGTKTFTGTFPNAATTKRAIIVLELANADLVTPREGLATGNSFDAAGAIATGNLAPTPSVDGEYIAAYAVTDNGAITSGTGYTSLFAETTVNNSVFEGLAQAVAAAIPGRFVLAATGSWAAIALSFKPGAGGGAPVGQRRLCRESFGAIRMENEKFLFTE